MLNSIKSGSIILYPVAVAVIILTGIGIIIAACLASSLALQIALGLGGAGLICLGLVIIKLVHEERQSQEKLDALMTRLDELQQELQKKEESGKSGIAIADIISSSLKFYSEYKNRDKKEE